MIVIEPRSLEIRLLRSVCWTSLHTPSGIDHWDISLLDKPVIHGISMVSIIIPICSVSFHIHATELEPMWWAIAISTWWLPSILKNSWSYHSQAEAWWCGISPPHQDPLGPKWRPVIDDFGHHYPWQSYYYSVEPHGPFHALALPGHPWLWG